MPDEKVRDLPEFVRKALPEKAEEIYLVLQIAPEIDKAIKSPKPYTIYVAVSHGELLFPPKIPLEQAWGFTKSKVKETIMALKEDHSQW